MDTHSKTILVAVIAFATGGAGGFFLAKDLLQKHYQELAQIEIDDVRLYYKEKYSEVIPPVSKIQEDPDENIKYQHIANKYKKPDLHELISSHHSEKENNEDEDNEDEDEDEMFENEDEMENGLDDDHDETDDEKSDIDLEKEDSLDKSPYLISYNKYIEPKKPFKNVELYYYRLDDTVCRTDDVVIPIPEDILGWDWIKELETKTVAFVRDQRFKTDYEIHALSQSYGNEVGSRLETDKEKKYRRLARTKKVMDDSAEFITEKEEETKKKTPYVRKQKKKIIEEEE